MLVGALEPWNFMTIHSVGNGTIIPTDELIFFRGVGIPPTRTCWKIFEHQSFLHPQGRAPDGIPAFRCFSASARHTFVMAEDVGES